MKDPLSARIFAHLLVRHSFLQFPLALGRRMALGLGWLLILVSLTPLCRWWVEWFSGPETNASAEVLVLLGGEVEADGILGYGSFTRCAYALYAWREGDFKRMVVAGGGGAGGTPAAQAMASFLLSQGVPAEALMIEIRSLSTRENIQFVKQILARLGAAPCS